MNALTCPKCQGKLESLVYQNIEVDRCRQCGGIWFDEKEADSLKNLKGSEIIDLGQSQLLCDHHNLDQVILCPRCHIQMIRMLDMDKYRIWYEQCANCHGIWLDAGEFNQFKQNFRPKGWLKKVRKLFKQK